MLVEYVNFSRFADRFHSMGRGDQFSYAGLRVLFDYLEEIADCSPEPIELDVIAICCDFTEYSSIADAMAELGDSETEGMAESEALAWLSDNYRVLELGNGGLIVGE
jgi:hypothetical protein